MSREIRDAYNTISNDYLSKKENPWQDFLTFLEMADSGGHNRVIDVGAGNGRNLHGPDAGFHIALELSFDLLLGFVGPKDGQKVAGSLPNLPFRKEATDFVICIAVLHHFKDPNNVIQSLRELGRIGQSNTKYLASVWRRWRTGHKKKLFKAIKEGKDLDPLINHTRPWYNSEREVLTYRFYHYYTFKELYFQLRKADFTIDMVKYIGGRANDANIFVKFSKHSPSE